MALLDELDVYADDADDFAPNVLGPVDRCSGCYSAGCEMHCDCSSDCK